MIILPPGSVLSPVFPPAPDGRVTVAFYSKGCPSFAWLEDEDEVMLEMMEDDTIEFALWRGSTPQKWESTSRAGWVLH
jgi:hypothetical protein